MVFSSLTFLYLFLPVTLILYFIVRNRVWRNIVLLIASLVFYAWGEPKLVLVMLAACIVAWVAGLLMERWRDRPKRCKTVFVIAVILLLGNLVLFKYACFLSDNLRRLIPAIPALKITLPIGISFYTFQIMSYVIDLYHGRIGVQRNPLYLALYVCCFPQLIAGPIVRYQTVEREIGERRETLSDFGEGLRRFCVGLAKKVILANNLAALSKLIYGGDPALYGTAMYWLAALIYALEIYYDFSGYSDMAIGLGRIFGFHFLENFDYPYVSRSVTEFWRRWHISLSTWFRDYVYIPLGGNRVSKGRWVFNLLVVWALTGFWHGAQWNFLLWGLYYGLLLLIEKLFLKRFIDRLPTPLRWAYTMFLVLVGWVLFNMTDFARLGLAIRQMFVFRATPWVSMFAADTRLVRGLIYVPLGVLFAFPVLRKLREADGAAAVAVKNILCALLMLVCIAMLISSSFNPFIYFRF